MMSSVSFILHSRIFIFNVKTFGHLPNLIFNVWHIFEAVPVVNTYNQEKT